MSTDAQVTKMVRTRQPDWTEEELQALYNVWREEGKIATETKDFSLVFRLLGQKLPHRPFTAALNHIKVAQVAQTLPYYGSLPYQEARARDDVNKPYIAERLAEWKQEQESKKRAADEAIAEQSLTGSVLIEIRDLLGKQNEHLANLHKFMAGLYRMAKGDEAGNYLKVEILPYANVLHGQPNFGLPSGFDPVSGEDQTVTVIADGEGRATAVQAVDSSGMPVTDKLPVQRRTRRPTDVVKADTRYYDEEGDTAEQARADAMRG